jgi:hypothetical protein
MPRHQKKRKNIETDTDYANETRWKNIGSHANHRISHRRGAFGGVKWRTTSNREWSITWSLDAPTDEEPLPDQPEPPAIEIDQYPDHSTSWKHQPVQQMIKQLRISPRHQPIHWMINACHHEGKQETNSFQPWERKWWQERSKMSDSRIWIHWTSPRLCKIRNKDRFHLTSGRMSWSTAT